MRQSSRDSPDMSATIQPDFHILAFLVFFLYGIFARVSWLILEIQSENISEGPHCLFNCLKWHFSLHYPGGMKLHFKATLYLVVFHRIVNAGRDLQSQNSWSWKGSLRIIKVQPLALHRTPRESQHVPESSVQTSLEICQAWCPVDPGQVPNHLWAKNLFLVSNLILLWHNFSAALLKYLKIYTRDCKNIRKFPFPSHRN